MPIDPKAVGTALPEQSLTVERGRLRAFAKATGCDDPIYTDEATARAAGHPDLPIPPTFLFAIELEAEDQLGWIAALGIDTNTVLHGEQSFVYHRVAHAGETLTARAEITGLESKRGGALELLTKTTWVTDAAGGAVADLITTIAVPNREAAR